VRSAFLRERFRGGAYAEHQLDDEKSPYGFRILSASLLMCVNLGLLHAEAAQRTIGQFVHTGWSAKDGAPGNVHALAQTTDGFLWLGTAHPWLPKVFSSALMRAV
jgi:hypothetical protein